MVYGVVPFNFVADFLIRTFSDDIYIGPVVKAIDEENALALRMKGMRQAFQLKAYAIGDTERQLLARGRYLLFKPSNQWSDSQRERADILFGRFPELEKAYHLSMMFRNIFESAKTKEKAKRRMENWFLKVNASKLPQLISASNSVQRHLGKVLNYFPEGSTNASAESFNAKLKGFRALVRGVRDIKFFLFRLETFYA
mgnify:CR=1 FL=1